MNLETKITIYKFTPQLFTLTPIRCTWSYAYICDILMLSKKIKNFSKKTTTFLKKNRNFFKNVLVFLLLPMHRKPSFCGGTDLSCVLFAGKKPKTPYFISSRNDL